VRERFSEKRGTAQARSSNRESSPTLGIRGRGGRLVKILKRKKQTVISNRPEGYKGRQTAFGGFGSPDHTPGEGKGVKGEKAGRGEGKGPRTNLILGRGGKLGDGRGTSRRGGEEIRWPPNG